MRHLEAGDAGVKPTNATPTTPCPWKPGGAAARSKYHSAPICGAPVKGVDEQRTCASCREAGAPPYVSYSDVMGRDVRPFEIVLSNAVLVDEKTAQPSPELAATLAAVDKLAEEMAGTDHSADRLELRRRAWAAVLARSL